MATLKTTCGVVVGAFVLTFSVGALQALALAILGAR